MSLYEVKMHVFLDLSFLDMILFDEITYVFSNWLFWLDSSDALYTIKMRFLQNQPNKFTSFR